MRRFAAIEKELFGDGKTGNFQIHYLKKGKNERKPRKFSEMSLWAY
jgi:hypothetical protein